MFKSGLTVPAMKATGAMTRPMERESSSMLMVMCTMASGKMIRLKDRELTLTLMEPITKDNGLMISSTDKELKAGPMVLDTKVIMKTAKRRDPVN